MSLTPTAQEQSGALPQTSLVGEMQPEQDGYLPAALGYLPQAGGQQPLLIVGGICEWMENATVDIKPGR